MLQITEWNGRFGNNILQLIRAIHYAVQKNHWEISFPSHSLFHRKVIYLSGSDKKYPGATTRVYNSFWTMPDPPPLVARRYAQTYLLPILAVVSSPPVDCVIHLRGGDIFSPTPHSKYFQPPLSYYKKYLGSQTCVVYEDKKNPCVAPLIETGVVTQSATLKEDFSKMLSAKHLVVGYSTLGYAVYLLSKRLNHLTVPSNYGSTFPSNDFGTDCALEIIDLTDYYKGEDWINSPSQLERMLHY
jgi:hypothetical protein